MFFKVYRIGWDGDWRGPVDVTYLESNTEPTEDQIRARQGWMSVHDSVAIEEITVEKL